MLGCRGGSEICISDGGNQTMGFRSAGAARVGRVGWLPFGARSLAPHLPWADVVHSHLLKGDGLAALPATLRGRRGRVVLGKRTEEPPATLLEPPRFHKMWTPRP